MKAKGGYVLLENGYIMVDLPMQSVGLNRLRFIANKCATALINFTNDKYGKSSEDIAFSIYHKLNALRFGVVFIHHKKGTALFVFDWLLNCGRNLELEGLGHFDFLVKVEPFKGDLLLDWMVKLGAISDAENIIFANASEDFKKYNSSFDDPSLRGKEENTVMSFRALNTKVWSEKEMVAELLGIPTNEIKNISNYLTENSFLKIYSPIAALPVYMKREIQRPITLPDGKQRSITDLA